MSSPVLKQIIEQQLRGLCCQTLTNHNEMAEKISSEIKKHYQLTALNTSASQTNDNAQHQSEENQKINSRRE